MRPIECRVGDASGRATGVACGASLARPWPSCCWSWPRSTVGGARPRRPACPAAWSPTRRPHARPRHRPLDPPRRRRPTVLAAEPTARPARAPVLPSPAPAALAPLLARRGARRWPGRASSSTATGRRCSTGRGEPRIPASAAKLATAAAALTRARPGHTAAHPGACRCRAAARSCSSAAATRR